MTERKVIIIGSGPAGLTAAIYAARASLNPLVVAGAKPGGQLMLTTEVENFPGFPEGIMGPQLMMNFQKQAERFGAEIVNGDVEGIDLSSRPFKIKVGATEYSAESLIIATGATAKWLGLPREEALIGHGISSCATCDGFFFRDKEVLVIGGGDSAIEEATFITKFARKVAIVHRRDELKASKIMQDRARANDKISFILNSVVEEVLGDEKLTGVKLKNVKTGEITEVPADGMFVAIGHEPSTKAFQGLIELDQKGYVIVHDRTRTSREGIFVAGDVHDHHYRQAITASGFGCMAAIDAEKWLELVEAGVDSTW